MTTEEMDRLKELWPLAASLDDGEFEEMLALRDKLVTLILG